MSVSTRPLATAPGRLGCSCQTGRCRLRGRRRGATGSAGVSGPVGVETVVIAGLRSGGVGQDGGWLRPTARARLLGAVRPEAGSWSCPLVHPCLAEGVRELVGAEHEQQADDALHEACGGREAPVAVDDALVV